MIKSAQTTILPYQPKVKGIELQQDEMVSHINKITSKCHVQTTPSSERKRVYIIYIYIMYKFVYIYMYIFIYIYIYMNVKYIYIYIYMYIYI